MSSLQLRIIATLIILLLGFAGYKTYRTYVASNPKMVVVDTKAIIDLQLKGTNIAEIPSDKLEAHVDNAIEQATGLIRTYAKQHNVVVFNKTVVIGELEDITPRLIKDNKNKTQQRDPK